MAWESVDHILDTKPVIGKMMSFDFAQLPISSHCSNMNMVVLSQYQAEDSFTLQKSEAGYAAFIEPEDFHVSKKLENNAKKIFKPYIKACKIELERIEKALDKKTKTCFKCKTLYKIETLSDTLNQRISNLKNTINILESRDYKEVAKVNFALHFQDISCSCCAKKHFLLTDSTADKISELESISKNLHSIFEHDRNLDADKQSKKKNVKIKYVVRGLIHESQVDHYR